MKKTNIYKQPEQEYYIDSCKILINSDLLKQINLPKQYLIDSNGLLLQEFKEKAYFVEIYNIKLYFARMIKILKGVVYDYFVLLLNSKHNIFFSGNYFYGVTQNLLIDILILLRNRQFINFNDVNILIENAFVKDIDICKNYIYYRNTEQAAGLFKLMNERFKCANKDLSKGAKLHNSKTNKGFQINHRKSKEIYLKWYLKSLEFKVKDELFLLNFYPELRHLIELNQAFIVRFEFNLKTKQKINKLFNENKLQTILFHLNYNQKLIKDYHKQLINKYFHKPEIKRNYKEIRPLERIILDLLILLYQEKSKQMNELEFNLFIINTLTRDYKKTEKKRISDRLENYLYMLKNQVEKEAKKLEVYRHKNSQNDVSLLFYETIEKYLI